MNGSALQYFRYFSKVFSLNLYFWYFKLKSSNWFSRAIFSLTREQVSLCFLCINLISYFRILAQKVSWGSCSECSQVTPCFTRSEEGGVLKNKWYLISSGPKWLTLLPDRVLSETFYYLLSRVPGHFPICHPDKKQGRKISRVKTSSDTSVTSEISRRRRRQLRGFLRRDSSQRLVLVGNVPKRHAEWRNIL